MDRNVVDTYEDMNYIESLSARRAWIEIAVAAADHALAAVALRKESVDRNACENTLRCLMDVALRKESVDRNSRSYLSIPTALSRSPQGARG